MSTQIIRLPAVKALTGLSRSIGGAYFILIFVGKLALDHIGSEALLIQDGASDCSKAMAGHAVLISHTTQSHQYRAITHMFGFAGGAKKDEIFGACTFLERTQNI